MVDVCDAFPEPDAEALSPHPVPITEPPHDDERYVLTVKNGIYEWYEIGRAVRVGKITVERRASAVSQMR